MYLYSVVTYLVKGAGKQYLRPLENVWRVNLLETVEEICGQFCGIDDDKSYSGLLDIVTIDRLSLSKAVRSKGIHDPIYCVCCGSTPTKICIIIIGVYLSTERQLNCNKTGVQLAFVEVN